jgi:hypothetical protein
MSTHLLAGALILAQFAQGDVYAKVLLPETCWACSHRSVAAKNLFKRMTGYPEGRPGYVIDPIDPLVCGGKDEPSNMQWQTIAEGRAKDRWESIGCAHGHRYAPNPFINHP